MDRNPISARSHDLRTGRHSRGSDRYGRGGRSVAKSKLHTAVDKKMSPGTQTLAGPIRDEAYIKNVEIDSSLPPVKARWLDNPKSTVSNYYLHNFGKYPVYEVTEGSIEGKKLFRYAIFTINCEIISPELIVF